MNISRNDGMGGLRRLRYMTSNLPRRDAIRKE